MILPELTTRDAWELRRQPEIDEDDLWLTPGPVVWQAERFRGPPPMFYPVYRSGDLYATSPLPLIVHKGALELDADVARQVGGAVRYLATNATIDRRVRRVGCPQLSTLELSDPREYVAEFAAATRADVAGVEARRPGFTNLVLCGGKDSLNLLLLPWKNPVIAVSARPNFPLVQQFVKDNRLGMDVVELVDRDASLLDSEIAVNACRIGLDHVRWVAELRELAGRFERRAIFWVGAMADVLTTPKWRTYNHSLALARLRALPGLRGLAATDAGQSLFWWTCYYRGGMWQGGNMSLLKEITDALVLSAYHGPAMRSLLAHVDLRGAVTADIRAAIGEALAGGPVVYPTTNPSPPPSPFRKRRSHVAAFVEVLARHGIRSA
ncbi:hypothetical protein [Nannocystis pusilla]|uniref:hypothetical protein n=1 Tax=Nannocystis pusilla TaxID=889268 RepID=UPI003DA5711F